LTSHNTSSTSPTPALVAEEWTMGYWGRRDVACANPGNFVKDCGHKGVGAIPESESPAIKTRLGDDGCTNTAGTNSN
jgi:hypothetical protein